MLLPDAFFERWDVLSEHIRAAARAKDALNLRASLQRLSADPSLRAERRGAPDFQPVLEEIPEAELFFAEVLPRICDWALKAERLKGRGLARLGGPGGCRSVSLSHGEAATLLALAFLGLLSGRSLCPLAFPKDGCAFPPNTEKLRCFVSYFQHVEEGEGILYISRARLSGALAKLGDAELRASTRPLAPCIAKDLGTSIADSKAPLHVDFANKSVGGGIFLNAPGATAQEEITFATHPELCVATVLCEALEEDEALLIHGARRFCRHGGFLESFRFLGPVAKEEPEFNADAVQVVIDAKMYDGGGLGRPYRHDHRLQVEDGLRDLRKALCGFRAAVEEFPTRRSCATGNWGCGAFGGASAVKLLLQWLAASLADSGEGFGLEYHAWDDAVILEFLRSDAARSRLASATVGQLWAALVTAAERQSELPNEVKRYPEDGAEFLRAVLEELP